MRCACKAINPLNKLRNRIAGCLLGGAIGDALGGVYEGSRLSVPDDRALQLSDDTQLTLATCEAIIECSGTIDPETIAARFATWHRASRITGLGASTLKALTELVAGGHWALVGRKGERAAGNGAAMRSAPLGFCVDPGDRTARQTIRDVSRITHHHEEAYAGALAVVIAVRAAYNGAWTGENDLIPILIEGLPDTQFRDQLLRLPRLDERRDLKALAQLTGTSGYVIESVPLALAGASLIGQLEFDTLIKELISCGGDTDTIAAIAGQVAGTLIGKRFLPRELLGQVPQRDLIESIAEDFSRSVDKE